MSELALENPFWRFSLRVYSDPEVRDECLALQDRFGIDVNLLLFAAWLAAERGIRITESDAAAMRSCAGQWHAEVVLPLRSARRSIKEMEVFQRPQVVEFRRKVAAVELAAEKIEQALLFEWAAGRWPADTGGDVSVLRGNIAAYLSHDREGGAVIPQAPALERASQSV